MQIVVACLLAFLLAQPQQVDQRAADPCRRPHCTLASDDLPLLLALADMPSFGREKLRLAPGVEESGRKSAMYLWDRHRQGHGGWPANTSAASLVDIGSVPCDSVGLAALVAASYATATNSDSSLRVSTVARVLEVNGRTLDAERLLLAAIPAGSTPGSEYAWQDYARFLARSGRYEEALPLIELDQPPPGGCGLGVQSYLACKFSWIEFCGERMDGGTCPENRWERRFELRGLDGLAPYVADQLRTGGSADPISDASHCGSRRTASNQAN